MTRLQREAREQKRWKEITAIEPRLLILEQEAKAFKKATHNDERVCANDRWYGYSKWKDRGLRNQMIYLVGFLAHDPRIQTPEAYDIAYQHLYGLLPNCRNCGE